jgi:hypothetical protein
MSELVADRGRALEQRDGARALAVAQEMEGALMSAMEGKLANVVLWEQFLLAPSEMEAPVTAVVGSLMEADPVLREWLEASLLRYEQASTE